MESTTTPVVGAIAAPLPKKKRKPKGDRPKVIGLKALRSKVFNPWPNLPEIIRRSFGDLADDFIMIIWARSFSGKSNFIYIFVSLIMKYGNVLYISLEEGTKATAQKKAQMHLNEEDHGGKILFASHDMTYTRAVEYLKRKKSPRFVVVDSVQYWEDFNKAQYKHLKAMFPKKTFIFISHAEGKQPKGDTAKAIRYDADIKVWCEGFVALVESRFEGNRPFVIWEGDKQRGAIHYWGVRKVNEFKK